MIKPSRLKQGDTIGVIAPAGRPDKVELTKAVHFLLHKGFNVKIGEHVYAEYGYLAGRDEERLSDLHTMFADPEVKAVVCARGGYGTARFAADIDYDLIKKNPKIFWGYSDITFLHLAFNQKADLVTFHGPMLSSDKLGEPIDPLTKAFLKQVLQPIDLIINESNSAITPLVEGKVNAPITGGNLALITSTLGTSFEIDTKGKLLFVEDIDEEPYSIDRMLNQLDMAGKLDEAAGFLIGNFKNCEPKNPDKSLSLEQVLNHYLVNKQKPTVAGLPIGHCTPHISIPLGTMCLLDVTKKVLKIESGVI